MSVSPRLTVVLPVLDEAKDLGALLDHMKEQDPVPGGFEVLVVDGGSTDGTRDLVLERATAWPDLRLMDNPRRRSGPARNIGGGAARGEFILYLDGHCSLDRPDYLAWVVGLFDESGADCLCRPQPLTEAAGGGWGDAIAAARHSPLGHAPGSDIYSGEAGFTRPESAGAAYRVKVFKRLGGYDERFDACEDVEFNRRVAGAGFTAYKHPDLAVAYRPRETLGGLFRQMIRYGRGRARLMARHPSMVPWVLVGLTVAAIVFLVALLAAPGVTLAAAVILLAGYAGACVVEGRRLGRGDALRVAMVFPAIHFGLLLGFWRGLPETGYFAGPPRTGRDRKQGGDHAAA